MQSSLALVIIAAMEFNGEILKLNGRDSEDRLMISDLLLAFARTIHEGLFPVDPELRELELRINASSLRSATNRNPKQILELDIDEIQICAGLIDPAIKTHEKCRLPVESMQKTRDMLSGLLDGSVC